MIEKIKLKHLETIVSEKIDYKTLIEDIEGFKYPFLLKSFRFKIKMRNIYSLIQQVRLIDISKIDHDTACDIKYPKNIDNISFRAMMEVQALANSNVDTTEYIRELITITCYQENVDEKYDSNSQQFIKFRERVENTQLLHAIGLFNLLNESLIESNKAWEKRFLKVGVEDPDYMQAGGMMMQNFNVINTIKAICQDFNITYDDAWHMTYALTQTNSLAKATQNYIQDEMRKIKENRMRSKRNSH